MAGKIYTDGEALRAVRASILRCAEAFQNAQNDFSLCFEQMNRQIDNRLHALAREAERCAEKKRSVGQRIENKNNGRTDSFVCDACGTRMMLKVYGDTTHCRACSGTMHRVYTDGEYNQSKLESQQLDQQLQRLETETEQTAAEYSRLRQHQDAIMQLLTLGGSEDPQTSVAFIEHSLQLLEDYQSVLIDAGVVKKNR